jgi:hypothetical protein
VPCQIFANPIFANLIFADLTPELCVMKLASLRPPVAVSATVTAIALSLGIAGTASAFPCSALKGSAGTEFLDSTPFGGDWGDRLGDRLDAAKQWATSPQGIGTGLGIGAIGLGMVGLVLDQRQRVRQATLTVTDHERLGREADAFDQPSGQPSDSGPVLAESSQPQQDPTPMVR